MDKFSIIENNKHDRKCPVIHIYTLIQIIYKLYDGDDQGLGDNEALSSKYKNEIDANPKVYTNIQKSVKKATKNFHNQLYIHLSDIIIFKFLPLLNILDDDVHFLEMSNITYILETFGENEKHNQQWKIQIDRNIKECASNKILTYVKIRNDNEYDYNSRFNMMLFVRQGMLGGTPDHYYNEMLIQYQDTKDKIHESIPNSRRVQVRNHTVKNQYNYIFGKYTRIFPPRIGNNGQTNEVIANNVNDA